MRLTRIIFDDSIVVTIQGKKYVPLEVAKVLTSSHWDSYETPWEARFFSLRETLPQFSYEEIAKVLTKEGYRATSGKELTAQDIHVRLSNMKRKERTKLGRCVSDIRQRPIGKRGGESKS